MRRGLGVPVDASADDNLIGREHGTNADVPSNLDRLYREQGPKLLRFLSRRANSDAAQDLVQQTFVRYAGLSDDRLQSIECPEAYLYRTAGNLARDAAKSARRRSEACHVNDVDATLPAGDLNAALEARDMLRRIETATMRMRRLTREIFMAHRLDGYSYAEIAARTGLSVKGVEKQMSKAIAQLERALRPR